MRSGLTTLLLAVVPSLPAFGQSLDEPEFSYVMTMQFNGCSMAEEELAFQLQASGIDRAAQDAKTEELVARGDATVTVEDDGTRRISMPEWACAPVEFGEWEVETDPLSPEEEAAKYREAIYVGIMASRDCTMTDAEMIVEMPLYGLVQPLHEELTQSLIEIGLATVADEADGGQRVTLGPDVCTPGVPGVTLIPAKPESVAKFTELVLGRGCSVGIGDLEAIEAELRLEPAETYPVTVVMEVAGQGQYDFENGVFRLINKDCP